MQRRPVEFYWQIAQFMRALPDERQSRATKAVADEWNVKLDTARGWIKRARSLGFLEKSGGPGRPTDGPCRRCGIEWPRHQAIKAAGPTLDYRDICIKLLLEELGRPDPDSNRTFSV